MEISGVAPFIFTLYFTHLLLPTPSARAAAGALITDDILIMARKSQVKAAILEQLGMSDADSERLSEQAKSMESGQSGGRGRGGGGGELTIPKRLRDELLEANRWMYEQEEEEEEVLGDVTQLIMFAGKYPTFGYQCGGKRAKSPSACLSFDVTEVSPDTRVESATLWIYKRRDGRDGIHQVFVVDEVLPPEYQLRLRPSDSNLATTDIKSGWVLVDVTRVLNRWLSKSYRDRQVKVVCKTCATSAKYSPIDYRGEHRPLIVVNTRKVLSPARRVIAAPSDITGDSRGESGRAARSVNTLRCQQTRSRAGLCCLKQFGMTFAEIGMDYIIEPREFLANYCNGSCSAPGPVGGKYRVSAMLQTRAQRETDPELRAAMTPCCAPIQLNTISVIYQNSTDEMIRMDLKNMSIAKCGCA